jgi:hypothetical protein
MAALVAAGAGFQPTQRNSWALAGLTLYVVVLAAFTMARFTPASKDLSLRTYGAALRLGMPLMVVTLFSLLATTSGRLGIGIFTTPEMTADYAVLYRAMAVPIVAHQIVVVGQFRKFFEVSIDHLERKLPVIVILVAASVVLFWALSGPLGWLLGPAFVSAFERYRMEGLIILAQCVLWSAIALNDLISARRLIAPVVARWSAVYFAVTLPLFVVFLVRQEVDMRTFVVSHALLMLGYFTTQALAMSASGVRLKRTWMSTWIAFACLALLSAGA